MTNKLTDIINKESLCSYRLQLLPRLIRHRDAAAYLGIERHKFDSIVRPKLTEILISRQTLCFDRLELDAWVEHVKEQLKSANSLPELPSSSLSTRQSKRRSINKHLATSRKDVSERDFDRLVKQIIQK